MLPHSANVLPDGAYDPRMYELAYEPAGRGRYRIVRGLGCHIGFVAKTGFHWITQDTEGNTFGHAWQLRYVAAHMLSHTVPLPPPGDEERFRVTIPEGD